MKFNLSIFSFIDCAFGVVSKKPSPYSKLPGFLPMLASGSFTFYI